MPLERDSEAEIVITRFWGTRASGWFFMLAGIGWFVGLVAAAGLAEGNAGERIAGAVFGFAFGIALFLVGAWMANPTTQITFDQHGGYMTMRWRTWFRHWPPLTRTKHISKEDIKEVSIQPVTRRDWYSEDARRTWYQVWVVGRSGKRVLLLDYDDQSVADRLVQRISEFSGAPRIA